MLFKIKLSDWADKDWRKRSSQDCKNEEVALKLVNDKITIKIMTFFNFEKNKL